MLKAIEYYKIPTSNTITAIWNDVAVGTVEHVDKHAGLFGRYNGLYITQSAGVRSFIGSLKVCMSFLDGEVVKKFKGVMPTPSENDAGVPYNGSPVGRKINRNKEN